MNYCGLYKLHLEKLEIMISGREGGHFESLIATVHEEKWSSHIVVLLPEFNIVIQSVRRISELIEIRKKHIGNMGKQNTYTAELGS